jgi:hypothetical protein
MERQGKLVKHRVEKGDGDAPEPGPEDYWRSSLQLQRGHLRQLEDDGRSSPKAVSDARRRVERIWEQGPRVAEKGAA